MNLVKFISVYFLCISSCYSFELIGSAYFSPSKVKSDVKTRAYNTGYSYELLAQLNFLSILRFGGFYYKNQSSTLEVREYDSSEVQNFHISPIGYGLDGKVYLGPIFLRLGYGRYEAEGRRVTNYIGRWYELNDGYGPHYGLGFWWKFKSGYSISYENNWSFDVSGPNEWLHFFVGITFRDITYTKIKILSSSDTPVSLVYKWEQKLIDIGGGILITF